jgi:DMSO/TMAO reductase YedYZ molybdopterin-dependent catalytic subunit
MLCSAMQRRSFVRGASFALAGAAFPAARAATAGTPTLPAGARASEVLDALPGKRPLIKRSFRPPNYETPVALFREPVTPNDAFYVRWHMGVPDVAATAWRLAIGGPAAASQRVLSLAELRRFPAREVVAVNQCSGNRRGFFEPHVPGVQWGYGAMGNARWRGARLRDVLESVGITPRALEVVADAADSPTLTGPDFTKCLPMRKALDDDTLIAYEMNGEPLSRWHGFPARLVVPGWTATYWVKCLTALSVVEQPFDGFWMKTAYRVPKDLFGPSGFESQESDKSAPITAIRVNSLVVDPEPGSVVPAGRPLEIRGIAWDGGSGIRRVGISADGGATWRDAELGRDLGRYAWRPWRYEAAPAAGETLRLAVRAEANDGSTQPQALVPNPAGYHHNVVQQAEYRAA